MGRRKKRAPRCEGCGLWLNLCICALCPRIETEIRFVLVQRRLEALKPTNTGRLVLRALVPSRRVFFGGPSDHVDPGVLTGHGPAVVLYPAEDAADLHEVLPAAGPRTVVVLDATWHQGSRMRRRVPGVAGLQAVRLPPGSPSIWPARTQHDVRGLSTFEACTRVVAAACGDAVAEPLEAFFIRYCRRLAAMRAGVVRPTDPHAAAVSRAEASSAVASRLAR